MNYAYIVRFPNDGRLFAKSYGVKFVHTFGGETRVTLKHATVCRISTANPPVLRRKRGGHFEWDYTGEIHSTHCFHRDNPLIRLQPGEGPILVDLDNIPGKRTSRDPED